MEARDVAAALSAHEKVCVERWGAIRLQLGDLKLQVTGVYKLILACAGALIVGMAGLIVTLVLRGHP